MPVRDKFPSEYFETNPLKGEGPHGAYKRLQWGNKPNHTFKIEAPEPMAVLGRLALLIYASGNQLKFRDWEYYVAIGTRSNCVYFVPMVKRSPIDFPPRFLEKCKPTVQVVQTDYFSEKGGEPGYYYHDHEKPYPMLCIHGAHSVLAPARHRGGRSYAVNDEGIIG